MTHDFLSHVDFETDSMQYGIGHIFFKKMKRIQKEGLLLFNKLQGQNRQMTE